MSKIDDIAKTQGVPWGEADRIERVGAFLAFTHAILPEAWEDNDRFFRFAGCVCRIFGLDTDEARTLAFSGAMAVIEANESGENGE